MTVEQVTDIARESVWLMIKIGAPAMLVALLVGVSISLLQALTQIQEMTISFVPKLLAVLVTLVLTTPFAVASLRDFTVELFGRMVTLGAS